MTGQGRRLAAAVAWPPRRSSTRAAAQRGRWTARVRGAVTDAARRHGRGLRPQCLHRRHRWRQQPRGRPRPPRGPCGAPGRRCGAPVRPGNGRGQPDHHGRGRAPGSPCERRRRGRCRERRRSIPLAQLGPRSTPGRRNAAVEPPGDGHGHGRWCERRQSVPRRQSILRPRLGPCGCGSRTLANSPSTADNPGCCCIRLKTGQARTRCERGSVKTKQAKPATHQTRPCGYPLRCRQKS